MPLSTQKQLGALVLLISISSLLPAQTRLPEPPPYQLTAMKVVPFSQRTSLFLAEIKKDSDFSGWNDLNLSLFVTIQVTGRAGSYSSKRKVEITAYENGRVILKRLSELGVLDEDTGKYYIPVWLYGPFAERSQSKPGFLHSRRLHRYNVLSIFNAANNFTDGPNKSLDASGGNVFLN